MTHWSDAYVGRRYVPMIFDCGELVRVVQREVFGREVAVPSERWYAEASVRRRLLAMSEQIDACKGALAEEIAEPEEGCGVLLRSRAKLSHIGIWCRIGSEAWVMHGDERAEQVVRTRARELSARHFHIAGCYRWT